MISRYYQLHPQSHPYLTTAFRLSNAEFESILGRQKQESGFYDKELIKKPSDWPISTVVAIPRIGRNLSKPNMMSSKLVQGAMNISRMRIEYTMK